MEVDIIPLLPSLCINEHFYKVACSVALKAPAVYLNSKHSTFVTDLELLVQEVLNCNVTVENTLAQSLVSLFKSLHLICTA